MDKKTQSITIRVEEEHLACAVGSGSLLLKNEKAVAINNCDGFSSFNFIAENF